MHRRLLALSLMAAAAGCSLETAGNAEIEFLGDPDVGTDSEGIDTSAPGTDTSSLEEDTSVVDSSVVDSVTPADTSATDTMAIDTFVLDTGTLDTGTPPVDTGPFDTGPFDAGTPDTGRIDTGADLGTDAGGGGILTGTAAHFTTTTVSLSGEGTLDWAHWGHLAANAFNHKSGANLISQGTLDGAQRYDQYPIRFTWSGGTPTPEYSVNGGTDNGIFHDVKGKKMFFDVSAHQTQQRTLRVYTTWSSSTGSISAKLSDDSAPMWSGALPPSGVTAAGHQVALHTFQFRAASPGKTLTVTVTSNGGYISLLAATLQ